MSLCGEFFYELLFFVGLHQFFGQGLNKNIYEATACTLTGLSIGFLFFTREHCPRAKSLALFGSDFMLEVFS